MGSDIDVRVYNDPWSGRCIAVDKDGRIEIPNDITLGLPFGAWNTYATTSGIADSIMSSNAANCSCSTTNKEKEKMEKKLLGTIKIKYNDQVTKNPLSIDHVIFSGPATIVFWADGDKTIVKCKPGDEYSYDVGIAMATLKKIFGDSYSVYKNDVKRKIKTYG